MWEGKRSNDVHVLYRCSLLCTELVPWQTTTVTVWRQGSGRLMKLVLGYFTPDLYLLYTCVHTYAAIPNMEVSHETNVDSPLTANVRNDEMPALSLSRVHNDNE